VAQVHDSRSNLAGRLAAVSLLAMALWVTVPILPGVLWAMMIGYWSYPLHQRLGARLNPTFAAALSTVLLVTLLVLPALWLASALNQAWAWAQESLPGGVDLALTRLHHLLGQYSAIRPSMLSALPLSTADVDWIDLGKRSANALSAVLGSLVLRAGDWMFHSVIAIGTLFFIYRDGSRLWQGVKRASVRHLHETGAQAIQLIECTGSAVTRGVILTALAQGALAGLGYWWAGVPQPLLLAVLTVPVAVVPIGAAIIWVPAALWLALSGDVMAASLLAIWGVLVVGVADNALRPLLMGGEVPLPFWPLTLSIVGATLTLGVPGVYVGPIVYALVCELILRPRRGPIESLRTGATHGLPVAAAADVPMVSTGTPVG